MEPPLPEEARSLGALVSVYRERHPLLLSSGGGSLLIGIAFLVLGVFILLKADGPKDDAPQFQGAVFAIAGLATAVYGVRFVVQKTRLPSECVYLLSGGLVVFDRRGNRPYSWGDIFCVRHLLVRRSGCDNEPQFVVYFDDGTHLVLDGRLPGYRKLGSQIQERCAPHLYNRYLNAILAGSTVNLGDVRLDRDAITIQGKKRIPYERIKPMDPNKKGSFYLREVGKTLSSAIVNESSAPLPVLIKLLNYLIHEKQMGRL